MKQHPWFDGIDWQKVADRTCDPPFKPVAESKVNFEKPLDLVVHLEIDCNEDLDEGLVNKFCSKWIMKEWHEVKVDYDMISF